MLRKDKVAHKHFKSPTIISVIGAIVCAFLASPLSGRAVKDYQVGGVLLVIGVALWALTWFVNRAVFSKPTYAKHPESLGGHVEDD